MLTTWLELENLKPDGKAQCVFVEKWQAVRMRVLRVLGYGIDRQVAEKLRSSQWLTVLENLFEAGHREKRD